ncbi:MAG: vitamin K epoxide reductase family protein [Anaerolineales bacterium]|nr:vitamin K epoxide reductase family protein [Anaerolineales bacterium]
MSTLVARLKLSSFNWLAFCMFILTVAGLGVSGYLMWGYTVPGATLSCGASSGCETVKNSAYANLAGIPLPVWGLVSYAVLLVLLVSQGQPIVSDRGWVPYVALSIFGVSLAGVIYSAYLTYIELFVIFAICRWCVASAIIMVAIFILSIINLRNNQSYYTAR